MSTVEHHDRRPGIVHCVVAPVGRAAQELRPAELGQQPLRIVVVAGGQVDRQRVPADQVAQHRVGAGLAGVGQVAGDDHAVRSRVEGEHPAEREVQAGGRLSGERSGAQVRIAEVCDGQAHAPNPSVRRHGPLSQER
jgi:hypothetical protein